MDNPRADDPRKVCPKCDGEMHWCSEPVKDAQGISKGGCYAKGMHHPGGEDCFVCVFCRLIEKL